MVTSSQVLADGMNLQNTVASLDILLQFDSCTGVDCVDLQVHPPRQPINFLLQSIVTTAHFKYAQTHYYDSFERYIVGSCEAVVSPLVSALLTIQTCMLTAELYTLRTEFG